MGMGFWAKMMVTSNGLAGGSNVISGEPLFVPTMLLMVTSGLPPMMKCKLCRGGWAPVLNWRVCSPGGTVKDLNLETAAAEPTRKVANTTGTSIVASRILVIATSSMAPESRASA